MPSMFSVADGFLVLLALVGIATASPGSHKQAGIHLPQRGQDRHQDIDRLIKRESDQTPQHPEWRGKGPVPDWATPGRENPEGNPWWGQNDYEQPPNGQTRGECKTLCLQAMPRLSPQLPWILGDAKDNNPPDLWERYCVRRCQKIYGAKPKQNLVPGREHPSKNPPAERSFGKCMKSCRDWYYNPLDFSGDGSQPLVKKRCSEHCGLLHPSHADPSARVRSSRLRDVDARKRGGRRSMEYNLGFGDELRNGIRSFRSGKLFRDLGAAMSEHFGGGDAPTGRPGFSGAGQPAIRLAPAPR